MKRITGLLALWLVAMGCVQCVGAADSAKPSNWRVGTAKAKITPDPAFWQAGYASRTKPAAGTLHDLWVKALALEDSKGQKAVVVTADLLGYPKPFADSVCERLQKECGLQRSQIMLTCSHSHSGPVLAGGLVTVYPMDEKQWELANAYTDTLSQAMVRTVAEALANLAPASMAVGAGECGFAGNRRVNKDRGSNPIPPEQLPLKGPSDRSVPVLAVHGDDGRLRAALFLYACHNTTLDIDQYSGDYAGFAQLAFEEKHPEAMAMFAIGCGADQNPFPRRTVELCRKHGGELADSVAEVLAKPMKPLDANLHTEFAIVDLPLDVNLDLARLEADAKKNDYIGRWSVSVLQRIEKAKAEGTTLPTSYPYPVQVWRLGGDQIWIALGGEVVVDYSLNLKEKYGPNTWVFGYSNDVMAYIPSARVWKEGGYEAGAFNAYGMAAERWCPDIETRIVAAVDQLVQRSKAD
jgi:hypothetical protein